MAPVVVALLQALPVLLRLALPDGDQLPQRRQAQDDAVVNPIGCRLVSLADHPLHRLGKLGDLVQQLGGFVYLLLYLLARPALSALQLRRKVADVQAQAVQLVVQVVALENVEGAAVHVLVEEDEAVAPLGRLQRPVDGALAVPLEVPLGEEVAFEELAEIAVGALGYHFLGSLRAQHQREGFIHEGWQVVRVAFVQDSDAIRHAQVAQGSFYLGGEEVAATIGVHVVKPSGRADQLVEFGFVGGGEGADGEVFAPVDGGSQRPTLPQPLPAREGRSSLSPLGRGLG